MTTFQTVTFNVAIDVTDSSRRADSGASFGFATNGNFNKMDFMLDPAANNSLPLPATMFYILTNGSAIDLTIVWSGSPTTTKTFRVNKCWLWTDMTGIESITVTNNYTPPLGSPPLSERVRTILV